ncbi:hypothetical protein JHW33_00405 [Rahnella aceris]|uniref:hypothetical protein n=1 Tax=Rahnella sp. (strain Y9602) TaxID=2703885 RepID=UPI00190801AD|nr:hypothetical protein [Rahnella aceris]QQN35149.1 hypothetical protein JHW33_00405 [Rahnella aceris]
MNRVQSVLSNGKGLLLILFFIAVTESLLCYFHFIKRYYVDCESSFLFKAPQNQFQLQGTMTLKLDRGGRGQIGIDGIVKLKGENTRINRYALFTYHRLNETSFRMDDLKIEIGARDNTPDAYVSENFFSLGLKSRRIFTLHRLGEEYLVGNFQAPAFMCLSR